MNKFINKVSELHKVVIKGYPAYLDFLVFLKISNAPTDKEKFEEYFLKELYTEQEFLKITNLIEKHRSVYGYMNTGKIMLLFANEIYEDYTGA